MIALTVKAFAPQCKNSEAVEILQSFRESRGAV
jgi:hypothetical protein